MPPNRWAVVVSAWVSSSNSFACCSVVMPMPVSQRRTAQSKRGRGRDHRVLPMRRSIDLQSERFDDRRPERDIGC